MKVWVISVLLLFLICLTVPLVTADEKIKLGEQQLGKKGKVIGTEYREDILLPIKKLIDSKAEGKVEVIFNGKLQATLPDDSPLIGMEVTQGCIDQYPYGTRQWYNCEAFR